MHRLEHRMDRVFRCGNYTLVLLTIDSSNFKVMHQSELEDTTQSTLAIMQLRFFNFVI